MILANSSLGLHALAACVPRSASVMHATRRFAQIHSFLHLRLLELCVQLRLQRRHLRRGRHLQPDRRFVRLLRRGALRARVRRKQLLEDCERR